MLRYIYIDICIYIYTYRAKFSLFDGSIVGTVPPNTFSYNLPQGLVLRA